jgi:hypothetical protein
VGLSEPLHWSRTDSPSPGLTLNGCATQWSIAGPTAMVFGLPTIAWLAQEGLAKTSTAY